MHTKTLLLYLSLTKLTPCPHLTCQMLERVVCDPDDHALVASGRSPRPIPVFQCVRTESSQNATFHSCVFLTQQLTHCPYSTFQMLDYVVCDPFDSYLFRHRSFLLCSTFIGVDLFSHGPRYGSSMKVDKSIGAWIKQSMALYVVTKNRTMLISTTYFFCKPTQTDRVASVTVITRPPHIWIAG